MPSKGTKAGRAHGKAQKGSYWSKDEKKRDVNKKVRRGESKHIADELKEMIKPLVREAIKAQLAESPFDPDHGGGLSDEAKKALEKSREAKLRKDAQKKRAAAKASMKGMSVEGVELDMTMDEGAMCECGMTECGCGGHSHPEDHGGVKILRIQREQMDDWDADDSLDWDPEFDYEQYDSDMDYPMDDGPRPGGPYDDMYEQRIEGDKLHSDEMVGAVIDDMYADEFEDPEHMSHGSSFHSAHDPELAQYYVDEPEDDLDLAADYADLNIEQKRMAN